MYSYIIIQNHRTVLLQTIIFQILSVKIGKLVMVLPKMGRNKKPVLSTEVDSSDKLASIRT